MVTRLRFIFRFHALASRRRSRLCLEESLEVRQDPPERALVTLEGTIKYRDVEDDVEGTPFKHRIAEIHATSLKRLSKIEAADDPTNRSRRQVGVAG